RAFHIDPTRRLDHWCGRCDKCCFIDLILAPFLDRPALARIFRDHEPLDQPDLADKFRTLTGLSPDTKPWECVGDTTECRAATWLAAQRPDRAGNLTLSTLRGELTARGLEPSVNPLLQPLGSHHIPKAYAAESLLV